MTTTTNRHPATEGIALIVHEAMDVGDEDHKDYVRAGRPGTFVRD
ncbi:hypothetical protein ACFWJT_26920 [Streptomyces sp. NPDC127069]